MEKRYKAMVSSDWNGCLAPCGPFDCIGFMYPDLEADLTAIFQQYTGNRISLGETTGRIRDLLPTAIDSDQMDAYLANSFTTYRGVPKLIDWCLGHDILFMINTTGMIGYFQRIFANHLLPRVPVLSAHPLIRYPEKPGVPSKIYELFETRDKGKNTVRVMDSQSIPASKVVLLGDSGGDGPHFEWGAAAGAHLIGSMTKPSLEAYCRATGIEIDLRFGLDHCRTVNASLQDEMQIDFMELAAVFENMVG